MVYEIFSNRLSIGIISYVVFIISASTHEYSHARTAYMLGDRTAMRLGRLTLNPLAHIDIYLFCFLHYKNHQLPFCMF